MIAACESCKVFTLKDSKTETRLSLFAEELKDEKFAENNFGIDGSCT